MAGTELYPNQYTSSALTKHYLYEGSEANFSNYVANENYQPNFTKHLVRDNVDGHITKDLGLIAAINVSRVSIPLQLHTNNTGTGSKEQKCSGDNFLIKLHCNPLENFALEYHFAYMPQYATYFQQNVPNSFYTMQSGGIQAGIKALQQTAAGLWSSNIGYSRLENSRKSDVNYIKNPNTPLQEMEGAWASIAQIQDTLSAKSDFASNALDTGLLKQHFLVGLEVIYQNAMMNRNVDSHSYFGCSWVGTGRLDSFGFDSSNCTSQQGATPHRMFYFPKLKRSFSTLSYGIYAEDNANFDLGNGGELNVRLGIRLDGDNYFKKHTFALRFSLNYTTPSSPNYRTKITFGANRYYGHNLITYGHHSIMAGNRYVYTRADVNVD